VLSERKDQMDLMAGVLLERETVDGDALEALLNNHWDEYIVHEPEILARKEEELRKQAEEDEAARIAEQQQAQAEAARQQAMGVKPGEGAPPAPLSGGRFSLEDVFSGRVSLEELKQIMTQPRQDPNTPDPTQQPPAEQPPELQPPADSTPTDEAPVYKTPKDE
jgi:cell division protease FtsH